MATLAAPQSTLSWFFNRDLLWQATIDSFRRMTPRYQWRNPVMFVVYIGSILTTILWIQALVGTGEAPASFILAVTLWLWATLLFANFAEAIAEGRSKAQAASLKSARKDTVAKKLQRAEYGCPRRPRLRSVCARATSCWSNKATSCPATAKSSSALRRSTRARSPAKARR